ncbi:hypothetical protein ACFL4G_02040 [Thermodesulfobacteriota bacterium]
MQIIRISFLDMAHKDEAWIRRYIEERNGRKGEGKKNASMKKEIERRRYARTMMPQRNDALISMHFSLGSAATGAEKPIELSENSASLAYRGDTPISHGMEIEKVVISLPGATIECRGRVAFIVKESD